MGFTPSGNQKQFALRLKQRRIELGLTQKEVAQRINQLNTDSSQKRISSYTISNWEHGHLPRPAMTQLLAHALNTDPAYLMTFTEISSNHYCENTQKPSLANDLQQIDINDLSHHGGEAVWIRPLDPRVQEYSALVSYVYDYVITADEQRIPFGNIQGTVWTLPILADKNVLSLEDAQGAREVFMDPIRASTDVRMRLRGWYEYKSSMNFFIKLDGSYRFHPREYGYYFVGYENDPDRLL